jgi:murein DD-endopeptidase MepM/ murein hydrolase activator NlpD
MKFLGAVAACAFAAATATSAVALPKPKYPVETEDHARGKHTGKSGASKAKDTPRARGAGHASSSKDKLSRRAEREAAKTPAHKTATRKEAAARKTEKAPPHREAAARSGSYRVARGDTLTSLAKKFGVSKEELADANGIDGRHGLRAGQKITVPGGGSAHGRGERAEARAEEPRGRKAVAERARDDSAGTYKVARGDTLSSVARRLGVSQRDLAEVNDLNGRHGLRAGQTLRIPGGREEARVSAREEAHAPPRERGGEAVERPTGGGTYTVVRGDTLSGLARRFHISEAELRRSNDFARGEPVQRGERLRIPAGARDSGRDAHASGPFAAARVRVAAAREIPHEAPAAEPTTRDPAAVPYEPTIVAPPPASQETAGMAHAEVRTSAKPPAALPPPAAVTGSAIQPPPVFHAANDHAAVSAIHPEAAPAGYPTSDQVAELGKGRFIWPVRGEIVSHFGAVGHDLKNDGLNIGADLGASVHSAADGEVVYAGDSVPGYGNLVLVKHADGWVTAYGHLSRIDVKMRDKVSQGQQIGEVGQSGGVDRPQLHFEVRYAPNPHEKARPVDPALLLP